MSAPSKFRAVRRCVYPVFLTVLSVEVYDPRSLTLTPCFCVSSCQGLRVRLMDCAEIKVEMAEGGLLDPLVIVEEGDETKGVTLENSAAAIAESSGGGLKREEELAGGDRNEAVKACVEKRQSDAEEDLQAEAVVTEEVKEQKDKPEETESTNDGQDGGDSEEEGKTNAAMSRDVNSGPGRVKVTQDDPEVDTERLDSSERPPEETKSQEEDLKKVCGLFLFYCGTNPPVPTPIPHLTRDSNDSACGSCSEQSVCLRCFASWPTSLHHILCKKNNLCVEGKREKKKTQQASLCYRACGSRRRSRANSFAVPTNSPCHSPRNLSSLSFLSFLSATYTCVLRLTG